jgi:4-hydroxybenzoyl-CoA thioesterase/acyl-CoA thioester hydrolase
MASRFEWPLRVYIEDTDAGGIVFYANYLKYLERARTEFMRSLGQEKSSFFEQQAMFVVHSLRLNYRKSAELDDELVATARIIKAGPASLLFEQDVYRGKEMMMGGEIKVACVDKQSLKPTAIPAEILRAVKQWQQNSK